MADSTLPADPKARAREQQRRWRQANIERVRENHRRYYLENRERLREKHRQYSQEHRERRLAVQAAYQQTEGWRKSRETRRTSGKDRAYSFRRNHGLTIEMWDEMWFAQDGRCYLCGDALSTELRRVHVDHYHGCTADHPSTQSCNLCRRGLTCQPCNQAIGFANDSPERLRLMADRLSAANEAVLAAQAIAPRQLELA